MTTSPHAERWHDKPRGEQATFHAAFENFSDSIFAINDQGHSLTLEPATCIDDIDLASSVGCIDPYFSSLQQDEFSIDMSILEHLTEDPAVPIVAHDLSATGNEAIHDDSEGSQQEQENCTDHNSPDICQPPDNINVAQAQNREGNRGEARNSSSQHFSAKRK
ncbi:Hypothetical protein D9617_65g035100 [Elsinoe fawcettii]|nr:Hypothetical protein D9617_65g035100 [Elsinoe fawcettii]